MSAYSIPGFRLRLFVGW